MKTTAVGLLASLAWGSLAFAQGGDPHSRHPTGNTGGSCFRAKVTRFNPEHLATVAPGAEFSFAVSGASSPQHIHALVKQIPVAVTTEDKDTFWLVKGKLPADIKNETVRLNVRVKAKVSKCDADEGILLKVSG